MIKSAPEADRAVPWLIYDGDCAFCTTAATWIAGRLDRNSKGPARIIPWQFSDLDAVGATAERAQHEVLWLDLRGDVAGGASAVAAWLRYAGGPYAVLGIALGLPIIASLAALAYRLIAVNRHRLPGGTPACALPPPPVAQPPAR